MMRLEDSFSVFTSLFFIIFYTEKEPSLMNTIELFLLALGLSMDAFAVSVCKGLSLGHIRLRHMLIAGAWFGGFQALMPTLGYLLGSFFSTYIVQYNYWISCLLLVLIGGNMIRESDSSEQENNGGAALDARTMLILAIATSIDALAVGVTFAFMGVSILYSALCIGCTTFVCSAIGVKAGSLFGLRYQKSSERLGGIVLILIGLKILLQGLGIL
jgi:putative Mn2+ efflux pump MntP